MDITTFYALFSATCFTLLGLWWNVVDRNPQWFDDDAIRPVVGGVYLAFLLPALMGLFAQVGGPDTATVWRVSFVIVALVGAVSTTVLLRRTRESGGGLLSRHTWLAAVAYLLVAVIGVAPELARPLGLEPIQAEAILLILLVLMAHGLVWEFMVAHRRHPDASPG